MLRPDGPSLSTLTSRERAEWPKVRNNNSAKDQRVRDSKRTARPVAMLEKPKWPGIPKENAVLDTESGLRDEPD